MDVRMVWQRWLARHDRIRDALPAVPLVVVAVGATAAGKSAWHEPRWAEAVWMALSCLPLAVRSRRPLGVTLFTLAGGLMLMVFSPDTVAAPAASLVALYTLATLGSRRTAWIVGLAASVAIMGVYAATNSEALVGGASLLRFDFAIAATALGRAVRSRRDHLAQAGARVEHAERTREEEARRRVTEERVRIARDLHDVVAHHITLVNAQAGVARHLMRTNPDQAYEALAHINDNSRAALDELRATVGLLRQPDDAPDLLRHPPASQQPVRQVARPPHGSRPAHTRKTLGLQPRALPDTAEQFARRPLTVLPVAPATMLSGTGRARGRTRTRDTAHGAADVFVLDALALSTLPPDQRGSTLARIWPATAERQGDRYGNLVGGQKYLCLWRQHCARTRVSAQFCGFRRRA